MELDLLIRKKEEVHLKWNRNKQKSSLYLLGDVQDVEGKVVSLYT